MPPMHLGPLDLDLLREWFCKVAERHFGVPYKYAGENPLEGEDCSQLIVNCLKSIGFMEQHEDLSCEGLWNRFHLKCPVSLTTPKRGALAFWFNSEAQPEHIAICLDHLMTIQAAGGHSWVDTKKEAVDTSAYVKYKRVDKDNRPVRFVDIFSSGV